MSAAVHDFFILLYKKMLIVRQIFENVFKKVNMFIATPSQKW